MKSKLEDKKQTRFVIILIVILGLFTVGIIIRITKPAAFVNIENVGPDSSIQRGVNENEFNYLGDTSSVVDFLIYEDYGCSNCKKFFLEKEDKLLQEYVAKGLVKFTVYPIAIVNQLSLPGANAVLCAADQGKFWEFRQLVFVNQGVRGFTNETFAMLADVLNMDIDKFNKCIRDGKNLKIIQENSSRAQQFGVIGTPTLVINGERFPKAGENSLPDIYLKIDEILQEINP